MTINPYDVQPMQPKGSEQAMLFRAVGRSLSAWEFMEYELSKLYEALIGARTDGAAAGYGTIISSAARLEMVKQAAEFFPVVAPRFTKELPDVLKLIGNFIPRRNDIAHGVASKVDGRDGWYLGPAWYHTTKSPRSIEIMSAKFNFGIGRYAYTVEQLDAFAVCFHELRGAIAKIGCEAEAEFRAWREVGETHQGS